MNAMCETLETRSLMSSTVGPTETLVADGGEPEPIALLVPAVQAAREAARSTAGSSNHTGGVNVCLGDGSVRMGDGSVRFVSDGVNVTTW